MRLHLCRSLHPRLWHFPGAVGLQALWVGSEGPQFQQPDEGCSYWSQHSYSPALADEVAPHPRPLDVVAQEVKEVDGPLWQASWAGLVIGGPEGPLSQQYAYPRS